jgi:hypothetical protein
MGKKSCRTVIKMVDGKRRKRTVCNSPRQPNVWRMTPKRSHSKKLHRNSKRRHIRKSNSKKAKYLGLLGDRCPWGDSVVDYGTLGNTTAKDRDKRPCYSNCPVGSETFEGQDDTTNEDVRYCRDRISDKITKLNKVNR